MNPSLPPGCRLRPAVMEDAPDVLTILNAVSLAVVKIIEENLEGLQQEWTAPDFDLTAQTRVVVNAEGRLYAYGILYEPGRSEVNDIDIYLHPDFWATDTETEQVLIAWAETAARDAMHAFSPELRVALHAWSYAQDERYNRQLERSGMTLIRHAYRMQIDFSTPPPEASPLPEGLTLRVVTQDEDWKPVLDAIRDAWRDHWGYEERLFDEHYEHWHHYWESNFREGLWLLAMDGDTIAGICLCRDSAFEDPEYGWISTLAVRRAYRRRGIARALLQQAFTMLYQRGKKRAGLGVDAFSLTGATDLYLSAGMHVNYRLDVFEKELRSGISSSTMEAGI